MASINKYIRELAATWINPTYATMAPVSAQIYALIVHAFINKIPEGAETRLLHEAYKRLQSGSLETEYLGEGNGSSS